MTAKLIDGREIARHRRRLVAEQVAAFVAAHGEAPGLATILVGDDPASEIYVRNKRRAAAEAGLVDFHRHLPETACQADVAEVILDLAADDRVAGILLQLPLPAGLDAEALIERIPPEKDVDGLTTLNQGLLARGVSGLRPCTPSGVLELLDNAGIDLVGAKAVVVGRSELVGHPVAEMLLRRDATVTIAHRHTQNLESVTRDADVLVVAAGVPGLITDAHVKPGAAVIDVGIHRSQNGLVGDVQIDQVVEVAGWVTPVPGGVGPMTIASLLANTVAAAEVDLNDSQRRASPCP